MKRITKVLKHTFVPHVGNDYQPHLFRELSFLILTGIILFLLGISLGSSYFFNKTVLGASVSSSVLVDLTNESRIANNEPPLSMSSVLGTAATLKANDMIAKNYFAHKSPEGLEPWYFFKKANYDFLYAGENLAINFNDSNSVNKAWLDSPTHRANLLDVKFKEIGIAAQEGIYNGNKTIFVVQMFGTPSPTIVTTQNSTDVPNISVQDRVSTTIENDIPKDKRQVLGEKSQLQEKNNSFITITNSDNFVAIKNGSNSTSSDVLMSSSTEEIPHQTYSLWYERLFFHSSVYVSIIYIILLLILTVGLIMLLVIEIHRQHWKHLLYATLLITLVSICININLLFL